MKHFVLTINMLVLLCFTSFAQNFYDTIAWVKVNDEIYKAIDGDFFSDKSEFNEFLTENGVVYYKQAMPFAKTPELLKIHEI